MNWFFVLIFIVFFVLPFTKKMFAGGKTNTKSSKNWGQTHEQIQKKYGHSGATNRAHKNLHSRDDSQVFPESHQARVRARDKRDQAKNRKMEAVLHGKNNRGIIKASNKGRSDWGERASSSPLKGLIALLILGLIAYSVLNFPILDMLK